jgi:hypothetical protein
MPTSSSTSPRPAGCGTGRTEAFARPWHDSRVGDGLDELRRQLQKLCRIASFRCVCVCVATRARGEASAPRDVPDLADRIREFGEESTGLLAGVAGSSEPRPSSCLVSYSPLASPWRGWHENAGTDVHTGSWRSGAPPRPV